MLIQKVKSNPVKADTEIAPEATELLFEVEDVAEIIAEVTGVDVEVSAEGDVATFVVGEDTFTVEAEGTEEIVESSTKVLTKKRPVAATRKVTQPAAPAAKTVKKFSATGKK